MKPSGSPISFMSVTSSAKWSSNAIGGLSCRVGLKAESRSNSSSSTSHAPAVSLSSALPTSSGESKNEMF